MSFILFIYFWKQQQIESLAYNICWHLSDTFAFWQIGFTYNNQGQRYSVVQFIKQYSNLFSGQLTNFVFTFFIDHPMALMINLEYEFENCQIVLSAQFVKKKFSLFFSCQLCSTLWVEQKVCK
jgi:hypothetical protein